jgi:hypothetical protein
MGGDQSSSQVGSFAPHTAGVAFDITKESDTLAVLKSIHRSQLDTDTKNRLRDAVFDYRQGFDHATLTNACELFAQVGITIVGCAPQSVLETVVETPSTHTPAPKAPVVSKLRVGRPRPTFGAPQPIKTTPNDVVAPPPVQESAQSALEPQLISSTPAEVMTTAQVSEPPREVSSPATASTVPEASTTEVIPPSPVSAVARINEIKKTVNDKVGNPVNLIEAHNELGREYMNALLEAMKKSNGGQPSELQDAMARLEKAFAEVLAVFDTSVKVAVHTPIEPVVVPVESTDAQAPTTEKQPEVVTAPVVPEPVVTTPVITSVAKTKQVEELMHRQMIESSEKAEIERRVAEEKMDPLMVSEVTSGLRQLLSEWSLFKSSGIFGTGPSGIDHALYKKISSLPMQAVIAGRFEGATPQIRQSISDYMNGWRYEEGIVFDYGESFEHYLRRVIRHILDKKAKTTSENSLLTKK